MKSSTSTILVALFAFLCSVDGFSVAPQQNARGVSLAMSTMAESGVPPASSESTDVEDITIPTNLPSEIGMDYIPLATMLATGRS